MYSATKRVATMLIVPSRPSGTRSSRRVRHPKGKRDGEKKYKHENIKAVKKMPARKGKMNVVKPSRGKQTSPVFLSPP
jgi:predicted Zn-ribbon and HTH transcriptional regulator